MKEPFHVHIYFTTGLKGFMLHKYFFNSGFVKLLSAFTDFIIFDCSSFLPNVQHI